VGTKTARNLKSRAAKLVTRKEKAPWKFRSNSYHPACAVAAAVAGFIAGFGSPSNIDAWDGLGKAFFLFWCFYAFYVLSFMRHSTDSFRANLCGVGKEAGFNYKGKVNINNAYFYFFEFERRMVIMCEWFPEFRSDKLLWYLAYMGFGGRGVLPIAFVREGSGILMVPGFGYQEFFKYVPGLLQKTPPAPDDVWKKLEILKKEARKRKRIELKEVEVPVDGGWNWSVSYPNGIDWGSLLTQTIILTLLFLMGYCGG